MEKRCPLDPIIEKLARAYVEESVERLMEAFDSSESSNVASAISDANEVFESCRKEVDNMIKNGQITGSSLLPCLEIWRDFGKYINVAERVSYFLYLLSKEFANNVELQKKATEEYLKLLLVLENNLFGLANKTKNRTTLYRARNVANRAVKIAESVSGYTIDTNLYSELLLAAGSTYAVKY